LELNLFPQVLGRMCALDCLDKQVADAFFLHDGRILTVGQGARNPVAKASVVVRVAAEILLGSHKLHLE